MKIKNKIIMLVSLGFLAPSGFALAREDANKTKCTMDFHLESWAVFYKSGKGTGNIVCDNGQKSRVNLEADGGGISFGKSKIDGTANFTKVEAIEDLYGSYASADAHAGAAEKSGEATAMTKGNISMSLSGKGEGWNLGFTFGRFKIVPVGYQSQSSSDKKGGDEIVSEKDIDAPPSVLE